MKKERKRKTPSLKELFDMPGEEFKATVLDFYKISLRKQAGVTGDRGADEPDDNQPVIGAGIIDLFTEQRIPIKEELQERIGGENFVLGRTHRQQSSIGGKKSARTKVKDSDDLRNKIGKRWDVYLATGNYEEREIASEIFRELKGAITKKTIRQKRREYLALKTKTNVK